MSIERGFVSRDATPGYGHACERMVLYVALMFLPGFADNHSRSRLQIVGRKTMNYSIIEHGDQAMVQVHGNIERSKDCDSFCDITRGLMHRGVTNIAYDMRETEFVSASFSGVLVKLRKETAQNQVFLSVIVSPDQPVYQVLELTGVAKVLDIYTSGEAFRKSMEWSGRLAEEFCEIEECLCKVA